MRPTVFVAGATGVLGRALLPRLVQGGYDVRGIARRARSASLPAGVELFEADLLGADPLEAGDLHDLVRGCDAVVHIATAIPADGTAPGAWDLTARLRTEGTRRLLEAALAGGVERYVQQSIVMAYRDGGGVWLDEQAPLDDSPERAATCGPVIEMEAIIREVDPQSLAWTILRGGSFVGPGTGQDVLIDELRRARAVVPGDGSSYFAAVDVTDMASGVVAALERAPGGSTFNIVDEPLRYGDYVDKLADLTGVARPRRAAELPQRPSHRCTNRAAGDALGWSPAAGIWPAPERPVT
jgi:nucleoside-diphosphate-sugar epimerase